MITAPRKPRPAPSDSLTESPLVLLAGGIALGALVGALIPRFARERELLDPVGRKLADRVSAAAQAAKDTGKAEIDALLPARDATRDKVTQLIENVLDAAKGAAVKA
ncbi:MAG: hypothetical protein V4574_20710 [Pseudomonadota bacterium]